MPSVSFRALAILAVTPLLLPFVRAGGTIACYTSHLNGGVGNIPIHNPEFYDGTDTYIGGPFNLACGEMLGREDGANFWITDDSCMNVETNGVHYWCCTGGIKQNDGSVTTCNFT